MTNVFKTRLRVCHSRYRQECAEGGRAYFAGVVLISVRSTGTNLSSRTFIQERNNDMNDSFYGKGRRLYWGNQTESWF